MPQAGAWPDPQEGEREYGTGVMGPLSSRHDQAGNLRQHGRRNGRSYSWPTLDAVVRVCGFRRKRHVALVVRSQPRDPRGSHRTHPFPSPAHLDRTPLRVERQSGLSEGRMARSRYRLRHHAHSCHQARCSHQTDNRDSPERARVANGGPLSERIREGKPKDSNAFSKHAGTCSKFAFSTALQTNRYRLKSSVTVSGSHGDPSLVRDFRPGRLRSK